MASRWSGNKIYSMFCQVFNYLNMQDKQSLPYSSVIPTNIHLLIAIISCICFHLCKLIPSYKNEFSWLIFPPDQEKALTKPHPNPTIPSLASLLMLQHWFPFILHKCKFVKGFVPLLTGCCEGHFTTKESTSPQEPRPSKVFHEIKQYEPSLTYCYSKMV